MTHASGWARAARQESTTATSKAIPSAVISVSDSGSQGSGYGGVKLTVGSRPGALYVRLMLRSGAGRGSRWTSATAVGSVPSTRRSITIRAERAGLRGRLKAAPSSSRVGSRDAAPKSTPEPWKKLGVSLSATSVPNAQVGGRRGDERGSGAERGQPARPEGGADHGDERTAEEQRPALAQGPVVVARHESEGPDQEQRRR